MNFPGLFFRLGHICYFLSHLDPWILAYFSIITISQQEQPYHKPWVYSESLLSEAIWGGSFWGVLPPCSFVQDASYHHTIRWILRQRLGRTEIYVICCFWLRFFLLLWPTMERNAFLKPLLFLRQSTNLFNFSEVSSFFPIATRWNRDKNYLFLIGMIRSYIMLVFGSKKLKES